MESPLSAYSPSYRKIDVFLSYFGLGSRNNFVNDIRHALGRKGISTRLDDISTVEDRYTYVSQGIFGSVE
ncbi:hypothetical protein Lser_V15G25068 [Lactuca serriola]